MPPRSYLGIPGMPVALDLRDAWTKALADAGYRVVPEPWTHVVHGAWVVGARGVAMVSR